MIPINTESDDYRFFKTLNEDVQLKPNEWNEWDIQMDNGDYINLTGMGSLHNAICIAIMTRFKELQDIPIYDEFGCRIHELIKANKSEMVVYEMELFVTDVLEKMRRIQTINSLEITEKQPHSYNIFFNVTAINDEIVEGSLVI